MATATDDFNRANGNLGANWGDIDTGGGNGAPQISSNAATGQSGWSVGASAARYTATTIGADQYSQFVIGGLAFNGSDTGSGALVRSSADQDGAKDYYAVRVLDDGTTTRTILIGKYVNGTWTQLTTTTQTIANGDTIRIEVQSTTLRAKINGTTIAALTTTDSAHASGQPGIVGTTSTTMDTWEAGDLGPSITAQPQTQTVYLGQTATFTITATGTGTLHYQWKDDGSNVGTDSSTYQPTPALSDSGSVITCVVTDDVGSSTSTGAYLIVLPSSTIGWVKA